MRLECVSEGIYTWSFQDRIAIRSDKMHEVTSCNQPLNVVQYVCDTVLHVYEPVYKPVVQQRYNLLLFLQINLIT